MGRPFRCSLKKEGKIGGSIHVFSAVVEAEDAKGAEEKFKKKIFLSPSITKRYIDEKDLVIEIHDPNDDV